jgi:hypothetical protein
MHRLFPLTLILFITGTVQAQRVIDISDNDANASYSEQLSNFVGGTIFPIDKYVKVKEGTPYYDNEWCTGTLIVGTGTVYQNLQLKLDLLNHEVHYKDANDREMILTVPLKEVVLRPGGLNARTFIPGKAWAEADKKLADSWLQVLVNDTVSLLLDIRKKLTETQGYSSATTEQSISDSYVYFLQKGGQTNRVTRWSQLLDLLGDKKTEVGRFVKENHLTGEVPGEYSQVVAYYNTL